MRRKGLPIVLLIVFLDVVGLSILIPVSAFLVRTSETSAVAVALLTVSYAGAQVLAAPLLGLWSDRWGRRPVLLICLLGSAAGYLLFGIGGAFWVLVLARVIDGVTGGNLSVANAWVGDTSLEEERAGGFALLGAAFGVGFLLGPVLGGLLSQLSLQTPAFVAAGLSLLTAVIGWVWLPESLAPSSRTTGPWNQRAFNPLSTLTALAKVPGVAGDLLALFLFELAFNGANAISQVFCINAFRASPGDIAILATVAGLSTVVVQGVLVRPLSSRFGERRLLKAGLTLYAAVLPMTAVVPRFWLVYPVTAAGAVCYALIWPGLTASLSRAVGSARQGALSGVSTAGAGVMSVLGPLICARAYDRLGGSWPYLFSSSMMVAALVAVSWRGTSTGRGEALASGPEGPRPMP